MCELWACVRYPRIGGAFGHTVHGHRALLRTLRALTEVNSVEPESSLLIRFSHMRPDDVLRVPQAGPDTARRIEAAQTSLRWTNEEETWGFSPHGSVTGALSVS